MLELSAFAPRNAAAGRGAGIASSVVCDGDGGGGKGFVVLRLIPTSRWRVVFTRRRYFRLSEAGPGQRCLNAEKAMRPSPF